MSPFLIFEAICCHVVQLLCDFVDACKYNHVIIVDASAVPRSWNYSGILNIELQFGPTSRGEIESPEIEQFLIVFILASKNVHLAFVHHRRVACSWAWLLSTINFDLLPFIGVKMITDYGVLSDAMFKSSKDHHVTLVNACCVLVSWLRIEISFSIDFVPGEGVYV